MRLSFVFYVVAFLTLTSCIGIDIVDDEVAPLVVILNPIDSLKISEEYQLNAKYLNNVGIEEAVLFTWSTSNDQILSVSSTGLVKAMAEGDAIIEVEHNLASSSLLINAGQKTSVVEQQRIAELTTVSSYPLSGSVSLEIVDGETILRFEENFKTTSALPGLYVYLSNNVNTTSGAYEIGAVTDFSGAQVYEIDPLIGLNDYNYVLFFCKPFNVAVGNGELMP